MDYYNIHNILKVASNTEVLPILPPYFKVQDRISDLDLCILEGSFDYSENKRSDHIFITSDFFGISTQRIMVNGLSGAHTQLYFSPMTKKLFRLSLCGLVTAILQIKLLQKGYTFLHTAGLRINNKGIVFAGWPETGKTSLVFKLAKRKNVKLLGDEYLILSKDGTIFAYPSPMKVGAQTKYVDLNKLDVIKLKIRKVFQKLRSLSPPLFSLLYVEDGKWIDPQEVGKIGTKTQLDHVYFLSHNRKDYFKQIDKEKIIDKLIATTLWLFFPDELFWKSYLLYCEKNNVNTGLLQQEMYYVLSSALNNARCFEVASNKKSFWNLIKQTW